MKINPALFNKTYFKYDNTSQTQKNSSFGGLILSKVKEVDQEQKKAQAMLDALAKGENVDLSELAITMTKADAELKLLIRVRNKIIDAYQEIMRMQI